MLKLLNAMKQQPIGEQLNIEALSHATGMSCAKINAWLDANAGRSIQGLTIVLMGGISAKPRYAVTRGHGLEKVPEIKTKHPPIRDVGNLIEDYDNSI